MKDRPKKAGTGKNGLLGCSHPLRILAVARFTGNPDTIAVLRFNPLIECSAMSGRAIKIASRIVFFICGAASLLTAVPYALLHGEDLPVESEWIVFVIALGVIGGFSVVTALMPVSWIAKARKKERDDPRLFSTPLKLLGVFAAIAYLVAVVAFMAPHSWNLDPQIMLILCPMYLVRMTLDPSPLATFLLLAPMNAAVYGSLGLMVAFAGLLFRRAR